MQEVFLRILKYRHTFRPDSQFSAWMYHVARNAQIDHFRKHKRADEVDHESEEDVFSENCQPGLTPEEQLAKRQETRLVRKALSQLASGKARGVDPQPLSGVEVRRDRHDSGMRGRNRQRPGVRAIRELADVFNGITGEKAS